MSHNIKMYLRQMDYKDVNWMSWHRLGLADSVTYPGSYATIQMSNNLSLIKLNLTTNWCSVCDIHIFSTGTRMYWRNNGWWNFCFCGFRFPSFETWKANCNVFNLLYIHVTSMPQHCWPWKDMFYMPAAVSALMYLIF